MLFKALNNLTPTYITNLFKSTSTNSNHSLRSKTSNKLHVPAAQHKSLRFNCPKIWNSTSVQARKAITLKEYIREYRIKKLLDYYSTYNFNKYVHNTSSIHCLQFCYNCNCFVCMFIYNIYLVYMYINTLYSCMFVCHINGHIYLVYMCIKLVIVYNRCVYTFIA